MVRIEALTAFSAVLCDRLKFRQRQRSSIWSNALHQEWFTRLHRITFICVYFTAQSNQCWACSRLFISRSISAFIRDPMITNWFDMRVQIPRNRRRCWAKMGKANKMVPELNTSWIGIEQPRQKHFMASRWLELCSPRRTFKSCNF